jgi:hypothetical protein
LPPFARQFLIGLAVTLMVALQGYGMANAQHRVEHALEFPGVAYADQASSDHHHDDDHGHDHHDGAAEAAADIDQGDTQNDGPNGHPVGHHHHSGGDVHIALNGVTGAPSRSDFNIARLGPTPQTVPPGADIDGLLDPPRHNA